MSNKSCKFKFEKVNTSTVKNLLRASTEKVSGVDNLDVKLLKAVADLNALPISHIINLSLEKCICPSKWKKAKIVPLVKSRKESSSCGGCSSRDRVGCLLIKRSVV